MYQSYNANADISTVIIYFSLRTGLLTCNPCVVAMPSLIYHLRSLASLETLETVIAVASPNYNHCGTMTSLRGIVF